MMIDLIKAWKYGNELANPAEWKMGAILTNTVSGLLVALIAVVRGFFPEFELPEEVQKYLVEIICGILVIINVYIHKASSVKV